MLRAMYSGITGLRNFQTQMDVLGNNIANVSTVGFKGSRVTFQTTLLQTLSSGKAPQDAYGGTNPVQIGLGAKVSSVDKVMSQGSFQNTGKKTDLAIQGDGFFVLSDGQGQYFTRAGNFSLDDTGYLVNPSSGMKLQGWSSKISSSGQRYVDTNDPIADVKISAGLVMSAKQTTQVTLAHNLNADVGIDETTMVIKSSLGKNLPIRFKFDRIMSNDYKDRYVYNWDAEVIDPDGRYNLMQETATGIQGSTNIKGTIELDESGM
ncbi:MAG TPA: flagellar hook-basal body complex protein [Tepiditoga sp.]|nr:flagellar hook-basal body complex protein [Tepiditoga sp.]